MKKSSGLSLVELIVTIIVIGVISVAGFEFFRYCPRFLKGSGVRLAALNFVREAMERRAWDQNTADTADWAADTPLPTGSEFGSELRDKYSGQREYEVGPDAVLKFSSRHNVDERSWTFWKERWQAGPYKIVKTKVKWNY